MSNVRNLSSVCIEHNPDAFLSINSSLTLSDMWLKAKFKFSRICWAFILMAFLARVVSKMAGI